MKMIVKKLFILTFWLFGILAYGNNDPCNLTVVQKMEAAFKANPQIFDLINNVNYLPSSLSGAKFFELAAEGSEDLYKNYDNLLILANDLKGGSLLSTLQGAPKLVKAWEALINRPQLRLDPDVLTSLSKALEDPYLKTLKLDEIINNKWVNDPYNFGCKTCSGGKKPYIDEVLDNLYHFAQYRGIEGGDIVIQRLLNSGYTQAIGANWVMKYLKEVGKTPTKFEELVDDAAGNFTADITLRNPDGTTIFIECKSWGSNQIGMGNVPDQLINYFNTQSDLSKFQFQFDPDRWVPKSDDLKTALLAKKSLFQASKWNSYKSMFGFTDIQVPIEDYDKLIDFITGNHFSNIINP